MDPLPKSCRKADDDNSNTCPVEGGKKKSTKSEQLGALKEHVLKGLCVLDRHCSRSPGLGDTVCDMPSDTTRVRQNEHMAFRKNKNQISSCAPVSP